MTLLSTLFKAACEHGKQKDIELQNAALTIQNLKYKLLMVLRQRNEALDQLEKKSRKKK